MTAPRGGARPGSHCVGRTVVAGKNSGTGRGDECPPASLPTAPRPPRAPGLRGHPPTHSTDAVVLPWLRRRLSRARVPAGAVEHHRPPAAPFSPPLRTCSTSSRIRVRDACAVIRPAAGAINLRGALRHVAPSRPGSVSARPWVPCAPGDVVPVPCGASRTLIVFSPSAMSAQRSGSRRIGVSAGERPSGPRLDRALADGVHQIREQLMRPSKHVAAGHDASARRGAPPERFRRPSSGAAH